VIAALLLAAGASTRMGTSKLLLPWAGGTILGAAARRLLAAPVDRVVLVVGHDADRLLAEAGLPEDPRLTPTRNDRWSEGMASSLHAGLAVAEEARAVAIALADQPDLRPEVVARLIEAWRAGSPLAAPVHEGRVGHPVLFDRSLFPELRALSGDVGARDVVKRHWTNAAKVEAPPLSDLDRRADYDAFLAGAAATGPSGFDPTAS
jgi:molybdenum cofactor cytidylyltransferase